MECKVIDGKAVAADIRAQVAKRVEALKAKGVMPALSVILVGDNPASVSYMRVKQDWDDGRREYDVKFYVGRTEYSCDVDIETGRIMDFDIDFD